MKGERHRLGSVAEPLVILVIVLSVLRFKASDVDYCIGFVVPIMQSSGLRRITMITDGDIFITNITSTYEDIPKYCNLVGAEFDQDYPANSTRLNITDDGPFGLVQQ
jgi:hypothetical protein